MTLFIWGAIILGLILAPMSLLLPSAQQKIQIELRTAARRLGIGVDLLPKEIKPGLTLEGVSYHFAHRLDAKGQALNLCLVSQELEHSWLPQAWGGWQLAVGELEQLTPTQQATLEKFSQALPNSSFALEVLPTGMVFWWHESRSFNTEQLAQLASLAADCLIKFEA